jgi:TfoX/Sxy family transcriptional regulator of competence genes
MTDDEELAAAVRTALSGAGAIREIKMFGGIGFMLNGNMVAAVSKRGLLLRVGKDRQQHALAQRGTRPMEMRGRTMEGYIYVDPPLTARTIKALLREAVAFVLTLPPKAPSAKPMRTKGKPK